VKDAKATLSLDLTDPQRLELLPLIFAYNHVSTEVARALHVGEMGNVMSLQTPLNELRQELERRGVLGHFVNLKGIENQALLARTDQASQAEQTQGEQGERNLN
jgi:hypothetical protein